MVDYAEGTGKQYHTQVGPGDVGRYVILPGDPGRCRGIASFFENPVKVAENREFVTYTGTIEGVKVSVTSTGIGGPSAAIAIEELSKVGADTFIRLGTCGGMQLQVKGGDVVVATGAVRMEGTSREYAPIEYPAVPDFAVTTALVEAARRQGLLDGQTADRGSEGARPASENTGSRVYAGVVQSKDSFFGQHEPEIMPVSYQLQNKWEAWLRMGCLASEMESAALFIAGAFLRVRVGACFLVMANQEREKKGLANPQVHDPGIVMRLVADALRNLIGKERQDER